MQLVRDILAYRSVTVAGMAKNTGKTETLNYLLRNMPSGKRVAVTSVGTDGERKDVLYGTDKPEIRLRAGTVFATSEVYYKQRRIVAEVLDITGENSPGGRILTARALSDGRVVLSGPSSGAGLRRWMSSLEKYGVEMTLVDGALSRLSPASPAVSEAMVLATGAAFSANMDRLVRETAHLVKMICLPLAGAEVAARLEDVGQGVWCMDGEGGLVPLCESSTFPAVVEGGGVPDGCRLVYVAGALTGALLDSLRTSAGSGGMEVVVRDFSKIFAPAPAVRAFGEKGGHISVLERSVLAGITVNPVAPNGMVLDSAMLREKLENATGIPVYDIMKEK